MWFKLLQMLLPKFSEFLQFNKRISSINLTFLIKNYSTLATCHCEIFYGVPGRSIGGKNEYTNLKVNL